jgi:hypothetical protein
MHSVVAVMASQLRRGLSAYGYELDVYCAVTENSEENREDNSKMANIQNLKPFKKGISGNPGGRPKRHLLGMH